MQIGHVWVYDSHKSCFLENRTIEIKDGKFADILSSEEAPKQIPALYAIPGMIDMHGHFFTAMDRCYVAIPGQASAMFLANGVTTVCSKGELEWGYIEALRRQIVNGEMSGPDIFTAGRMPNGVPYFSDAFDSLKDEEDVNRCFGNHHRQADFLKFYDLVKPELAKVIIDLAHRHGKKVYAHLGACTVQKAVELGLDGFEHGVFNTPELWDDDETCAKMPAVYRLQSFNPKGDEAKRLIALLTDKQTAVTPTISTIAYFQQNDKLDWFDESGLWDYYEKPLGKRLREEYEGSIAVKQELSDLTKRVLEKQNTMLELLYRSGGRIFAGSDPSVPHLIGGMNLAEEAKLLQQAGMAGKDVLNALTLAAAAELGIAERKGSIEVGKDADMVLLEGNPLDDMGNLTRIHSVIKGGTAYDPEMLKEGIRSSIPQATEYQMHLQKRK